MYNVVNVSADERLYDLAADIISSGRRPEILMKKYNIVYRKGKTIEEVQKARRLALSACEKQGGNHLVYIQEFYNRLQRIVMAQ